MTTHGDSSFHLLLCSHLIQNGGGTALHKTSGGRQLMLGKKSNCPMPSIYLCWRQLSEMTLSSRISYYTNLVFLGLRES